MYTTRLWLIQASIMVTGGEWSVTKTGHSALEGSNGRLYQPTLVIEVRIFPLQMYFGLSRSYQWTHLKYGSRRFFSPSGIYVEVNRRYWRVQEWETLSPIQWGFGNGCLWCGGGSRVSKHHILSHKLFFLKYCISKILRIGKQLYTMCTNQESTTFAKGSATTG